MEREYEVTKIHDTDPGKVVEFTQQIRYRMVDELVGDGSKLTANFKDLSQLLRDMDSSALTTRKLDIDEKEVNDGQRVSQLARAFRDQLGRDPYEVKDGGVAQRVSSPLPPGFEARPIALNPGEDAQGEQVLSVSNYVQVEE